MNLEFPMNSMCLAARGTLHPKPGEFCPGKPPMERTCVVGDDVALKLTVKPETLALQAPLLRPLPHLPPGRLP